jgi:hypothetical protein
MSNLQMIQLIINILLKGPTPAYTVSDALMKKGFDSASIYLTIQTLIDDKQVSIDKFWRLYLSPSIDCEECSQDSPATKA